VVRTLDTVPGMARTRRCAYCDAPLDGELGAAARYCSRSHRQRAYEARQDDIPRQLTRRIRSLERQLASFERILEKVADTSPACAAAVTDALREETLAAFARGAAAARQRGPTIPRT